jgi:hypothetical protein
VNGRVQIVALAVGVLAVLGSAAVAAAAGNHGKVGSAVVVKGQTKDVISVRITKVEDPLLAYGAATGMRNIGVFFTVKNVGKVKYSDSPSALASTADGQISGSEITGGGPCNTPATVKLAPGASKTFCMPFAILKAGKLAFIQYNVDGGYGTPAVFAAH